jgi:hypothetical protein
LEESCADSRGHEVRKEGNEMTELSLKIRRFVFEIYLILFALGLFALLTEIRTVRVNITGISCWNFLG